MSCYHPLKAFRTPDGVVFNELGRHDILGPIELPCGMCIGCRMQRASDWELRCMHEASLHESNCFVTLTYGRDKLPPNGSLDHRDFQLFMKRLRRSYAPNGARFYMCGEYGPNGGRPHYHANLFGVDFRDDRVPKGKSGSGYVYYESAKLSELWPHGFATVQDLTRETAGYTARYIMKKVLGANSEEAYEVIDADGVISMRKPEYAAMSLRPGIGADWFDKYHRDVFPGDYVIADGVKRPVPKYYDKLLKRSKDVVADEIAQSREEARVRALPDNTDERRSVREIVHTARVSTLVRGDVNDAS